ncbi:hypothetical protein Tco_1355274 [Tanacetum coccineum]
MHVFKSQPAYSVYQLGKYQEPVNDEDDMIKFCEESGVPVALDETDDNLQENPLQTLARFTQTDLHKYQLKVEVEGVTFSINVQELKDEKISWGFKDALDDELAPGVDMSIKVVAEMLNKLLFLFNIKAA